MTDPVAIVGAGPAGLAAAAALAARGVPSALLDDNARPGGQYLRRLPPGFSRGARIPEDAKYAPLLRATANPLVSWHPETTVWAFPEPKVVAFVGPRGSGRLRSSAIVVAAGAHDRACPFPGWTLPGIITAGGCLNLIKGQGMTPAGDIVVAGNGPLVLLAAASLARTGGRVRAVVEAGAPSRRLARALPGLLARPSLLAKGLGYRAALLRARIPLLEGWAIVCAKGGDTVERVVLAPIDGTGRPVAARNRTIAAACLVVGYGLQPSTELTRMAGCAHIFAPDRGGWVPERTPALETSIAGLFAAGETAGIGGAELARVEGRFVGDTIAARLGHGPPPTDRARAAIERFRTALDDVYALPAPLDLTTADTVVCRCEDITCAELLDSARRGTADLGRIKVETRLSMGRCQGRNCLAAAAAIIAADRGCAVDNIPWPRMRPPARPVPVSALLTETLAPPRTPDAPEPMPLQP